MPPKNENDLSKTYSLLSFIVARSNQDKMEKGPEKIIHLFHGGDDTISILISASENKSLHIIELIRMLMP